MRKQLKIFAKNKPHTRTAINSHTNHQYTHRAQYKTHFSYRCLQRQISPHTHTHTALFGLMLITNFQFSSVEAEVYVYTLFFMYLYIHCTVVLHVSSGFTKRNHISENRPEHIIYALTRGIRDITLIN